MYIRTRFVLLVLVIGASVWGLLGCIPKDRQDKTSQSPTVDRQYVSEEDLSGIRVGYCSPTLDGPFYVALEAAVGRAVSDYGMDYLATDGQGDINKQVMAVEDLLSKGIQVLILNPLDPKALVPVVRAAVAQGVDVFILDSMIEEVAPYTAAVVANNQLNGEILGQWLAGTSGGS